jgi:diguanylate cyclase (GGDEF)-like protein
MDLDVHTLLTVMLANVFAIALVMPIMIGWRVTPGARFVIGSAMAEALAWGSFLLARPVHDRIFSTIWVGLLGLSFVLMWHALRSWLGPRPGRMPMWAVAALTPLGYALGFDSYAFRVGWSNFGLAFLMLTACIACAWPAPGKSMRWRGPVFACLGALACVTAARGVLGAFYTELYPALRAPHPINIAGALLNHVAVTLTTLGLLVGWHEEADHELRRQASTDGLTGLLNRGAWLQRAGDAVATARRHDMPVALLMIDVDHFKQINDLHGHAAGDRALERMGMTLRDCVRQGDVVGRFGGEEFCVLVFGADARGAQQLDARIREALRTRGPQGEPEFTISSGLATLRGARDGVEQMLLRADQALYAAKANGRNRLVHSEDLRGAHASVDRPSPCGATQPPPPTVGGAGGEIPNRKSRDHAPVAA